MRRRSGLQLRRLKGRPKQGTELPLRLKRQGQALLCRRPCQLLRVQQRQLRLPGLLRLQLRLCQQGLWLQSQLQPPSQKGSPLPPLPALQPQPPHRPQLPPRRHLRLQLRLASPLARCY